MGGLTRALGGRLVQAALVALLVGIACFAMVEFLPGDQAYRIAAGRYGEDLVSTAAADAVRLELGLDRPWWERLGAWLAALARLDLGVSLVTGERVAHEIGHQLGHTLLLSLAALALSVLLGPPLGVLAAARAGTAWDLAGMSAAAALRALPAFAVGVALTWIFAVRLGLLPAAGAEGPAAAVLPALTLALGLAAASSRVTRDVALSVMRSPWVAFARTKGLGEAAVVRRHALRNAAAPVTAYLGIQLAWLVEGVVVVESVFVWPGIGHALVHAVVARDVPMIQGTALVLGLLFVLLNALVDLLCILIDPRAGERRR
ncbi:ABC transporter permease [Arenibaculum sp.]|uniref:ABC transporter permease n=1 Tax=Arenibaculum sp. TaxID=2865862 RepID=UPI002E14FE25|nr:ABC transporter permease [Arenibaculum sp.]